MSEVFLIVFLLFVSSLAAFVYIHSRRTEQSANANEDSGLTTAAMTSRKRSVLITGTSACSIGSALAMAFAKRGFLTFATARDVSKIDRHLAGHPDVYTIPLDVTSQQSINAACKFVVDKTGSKLDYLVNNAGIGYTMPLADFDEEKAKRVFDVNFWGVLKVTKVFMPSLVNAKGTVVNVSSVGAVVNTPWIGEFPSSRTDLSKFSHSVSWPTREKTTIHLTSIVIGIYSASKAALTTASDTLRLELKPLGVNVVTAMVGSIETKFHTNNIVSTLPPNSLYRSVEQYIQDTASGKNAPKGTNATVFAENLVKDVLQGKKGKLWRGNMASMTKWASQCVPWGSLDGMVANGRGVDKLEASAPLLPREPANRKGLSAKGKEELVNSRLGGSPITDRIRARPSG